jgi:hypothetical protein
MKLKRGVGLRRASLDYGPTQSVANPTLQAGRDVHIAPTAAGGPVALR